MSTPGDGYSQQPQWNAPTQAGPPPVPQQPRNGMGTAALVFGIIALVFCWTAAVGIIAGILAIIFGIIGRGRVKRMEANNGGIALAGIITGVLALLAGIAFAVVFAVVGAFFGSGAGQQVFEQARQCIEQQIAQGTPISQAQQVCQQQLGQQLPQIPGSGG